LQQNGAFLNREPRFCLPVERQGFGAIGADLKMNRKKFGEVVDFADSFDIFSALFNRFDEDAFAEN
jgi:hypothetical protein